MTRTRSIAWLPLTLVCAFGLACGGPEKKTEAPLGGSSNPQPTAKATADEGLGDQVTAYAKAVIKIIEANKTDCSALGEKLATYVSENSTFLKKMLKTADSIEAKAWKDENEELVRQLNGSMAIVTSAKCSKNSEVKAFVTAMQELN